MKLKFASGRVVKIAAELEEFGDEIHEVAQEFMDGKVVPAQAKELTKLVEKFVEKTEGNESELQKLVDSLSTLFHDVFSHGLFPTKVDKSSMKTVLKNMLEESNPKTASSKEGDMSVIKYASVEEAMQALADLTGQEVVIASAEVKVARSEVEAKIAATKKEIEEAKERLAELEAEEEELMKQIEALEAEEEVVG